MNAAHVIRKNISVMTSPTKAAPNIKIEYGYVQGKMSVSREGRDYFQYLGIPFAKPPVGPLRFQPPVEWDQHWEHVRDATKDGNKAMQYDAISKKAVGSEDCLFLNVHTPKLGGVPPLPVLVWFHGGSFILGSGNDYKPDYFMEHDVVVVTVNYRLGPFGFLDTGDGVVRGNMGLKDQHVALRWVQKNIFHFGGNPNDVTIAGESAGGASVHFHVLSPMSRGLFHKAMSQSGVATMPFSLHPNPQKLAKRFGEMLGCDTSNSQRMVQQMMEMDAAKLASVQLGMFDNFRPTIEFDFGDGRSIITQHPLQILESGNFTRVPYVMGVNSGEGILLASPILTNKEVVPQLAVEWGKSLAPFLFYPEHLDPKLLDATKDIYLEGNFDPSKPLESMGGMSKMVSDRIWYLGFQRVAQAHAYHAGPESPLYLYFYDHSGEYSLADMVLAIGGDSHPLFELIKIKGEKWIKEKIKKEKIPNYGPCHGDGLSMQWYMPNMCYVPKKGADYPVSRDVVDSMVQFVKFDPNNNDPATSLKYSGKTWEPQKPGQGFKQPLRYMKISKEPDMIPEPFMERMDYWKKIGL